MSLFKLKCIVNLNHVLKRNYIRKPNKIHYSYINLMEVDDVGGETLLITFITGTFYLVMFDRINNKRIYIYTYFVQLRHHQENTDLNGLFCET